jgi:glycosyltransferase involved in cell wall biosynthesis
LGTISYPLTELPLISIVIPSYNQGEYIEESLQSVFGQKYPRLECIVVDGASRDDTLDIVRHYAGQLAWWISEPDRGQSHAINKGLSRATGDIITFLGSDDIYLPGAFQDVAGKWNEWKDYGAIVGGFYYMDEKSVIDQLPRMPLLPNEGPIDLTLGPPGNYRLHQVSTFYNRTALDRVGRYVREDLKYTMDRELLYRIAGKYKIFLADRPYGAFRRHTASKSAADILPFSKEFARLHLMYLTGERDKDRMHKKMARYHRARGRIKYAKAAPNRLSACLNLMAAIIYRPGLMANKEYYSLWSGLFGLKQGGN